MTINAGVIGHPISHSLSPKIHGYWLKEHGIDGLYAAWDVPPADLDTFMANMSENNIVGMNVTLPHKEKMFEMVPTQDKHAQTIGAINTVFTNENGKLEGMNTDHLGFMQHLKNSYPDFECKDANVLVLGAGGAAMAIIYAMLREGAANVMISNRTPGRAEAIRDRLPEAYGNKLRLTKWEERARALSIIDVVIHTTSLGMDGQLPLDMDLSLLKPDAIVADIVYTPLETELLRNAHARGNRTMDGLGMLLHQAVPGFEKWYGVKPSVTPELRRYIESYL